MCAARIFGINRFWFSEESDARIWHSFILWPMANAALTVSGFISTSLIFEKLIKRKCLAPPPIFDCSSLKLNN